MTASEPQPITSPRRLRWYHPTPGRLPVALLAVEGLLVLSDRLGWWHKGYAVLVGIASVGAVMVLMFHWWLVAVCFHWRFQFSLRSLMVATVAVAIPFSWLAVEMKRAREQREAVVAIKKVGGDVLYDYQNAFKPNPAPPGPVWLRKLFSDDFFADVAIVLFQNTDVTDAELEHLNGLTDVQALFLDNTNITDAGLEHLKELTQLRALRLNNTQVTDAGLENLKGLTHLQKLLLGNTQVTDAGLVHLEKLTQLQGLSLSMTHITEKGVEELQQKLPKCKILH